MYGLSYDKIYMEELEMGNMKELYNKREESIKNKLIKLGFNISSVGFDYWIYAIELKQDVIRKEDYKMSYVYNYIKNITMMGIEERTMSSIERALRHASFTAKDNIYKEYNIQSTQKLTNKSILNLLGGEKYE